MHCKFCLYHLRYKEFGRSHFTHECPYMDKVLKLSTKCEICDIEINVINKCLTCGFSKYNKSNHCCDHCPEGTQHFFKNKEF